MSRRRRCGRTSASSASIYVAKRMSGRPEENGGKKITNIRLVYTGGAATAALAIADEEDSKELACDVIAKALRHAEPGMALFAPDGGWYEGARYWGYAVQYHQYLLASLQASTGTTYGLLTAPGFNKTANFPVYLDGPCGNFDFHDDDTGNKLGPQLSWFGHQFNDDYGRLRVAELDKEARQHQATLKEIEAEKAKNTAEGRKRSKDLAKADPTRPATVFDVLFYKPAFADRRGHAAKRRLLPRHRDRHLPQCLERPDGDASSASTSGPTRGRTPTWTWAPSSSIPRACDGPKTTAVGATTGAATSTPTSPRATRTASTTTSLGPRVITRW